VLARQLLLERGRVPLARALERIGGIQAQYAPSMYIGLWSRLEGFERARLTRALERRTVVQGTLMRSTIHLVSPRDYWPFAVAVREARRARWLRSRRGDPDAATMEAAVAELAPRLAGGPVRRADVEAIVGRKAMEGVHLWLDLIRAAPSGTWERRRADIFALAEAVLGPAEVTESDAVAHLVSRYLAAFGPASSADVESWSGLARATVASALERLTLRRFRAEDGTELVDLPRAPLPDPETPAPVRFLPTWDATLLVHARRTGILPEEHRTRIFSSRNPHSAPTFLVDGAVAGTWRHERGRIRLEAFGRLDAATRRALDREAHGLMALHA
jgi:hypothetical protein